MRINPPAVIQRSCEAFDVKMFNTSTRKAQIEQFDSLAIDYKANMDKVFSNSTSQSQCELSLPSAFKLPPIRFNVSLLCVITIESLKTFGLISYTILI